MELRSGTRLVSAVCDTGIIVVRPPNRNGEIRCGGVRMLALNEVPPGDVSLVDDARGGTLIGKRYISDDAGLEVLCTKSGDGSLAFDDTPLVVQGAKPLPPSD